MSRDRERNPREHSPRRGAVAAVLCAAMLSGCQSFSTGNRTADFPQATQFPQLYQAKLQAAAHWQIIARNEAALIASRFKPGSSFTVGTTDPKHGIVFSTEFATAYHHMLNEGLLGEEMRVYDEGGDFDLSYHVQVVAHDDRWQFNPPPGFYSGVVAGLYLLTELAGSLEPALLALPAAAGADVYSYFNEDTRTPDTEIVLTTAARLEDQVMYSHTSIYYLRTEDRELYDGVPAAEPRPRFRVSSPAP